MVVVGGVESEKKRRQERARAGGVAVEEDGTRRVVRTQRGTDGMNNMTVFNIYCNS